MPVQNGMGRVGIPDIIGCYPLTITEDMVGKRIGVFIAVETKAPGKIKNTTANQKRNLMDIHEAGGVAIVADQKGIVQLSLERLSQSGTCDYWVP